MRSIFILLMLSILSFQITVNATPSNIVWTTCTTAIVETGKGRIDTENYFTILNKHGDSPFFPTDFGLEFGILEWNDWSIEAGIDYLGD